MNNTINWNIVNVYDSTGTETNDISITAKINSEQELTIFRETAITEHGRKIRLIAELWCQQRGAVIIRAYQLDTDFAAIYDDMVA